jgi:hypothetical protein
MERGLFTGVTAPRIYRNVPNMYSAHTKEDYNHFMTRGIMQDFSKEVKTEESAPVEIRGEKSFESRFGKLSI